MSQHKIAHTYSKSQLAVERAHKLAEVLLYCTTHLHMHNTHTHTHTHHTHTHIHTNTHTHTIHTHTHHRDLSDEGPNRVTAAEETHFKYKNMGGFSFPPLHDSAVNTSSSDTSLLDGPNTKKLPPLHTPNTTYPSESSSTASLVEAKVKKHAKKSTRRERR